MAQAARLNLRMQKELKLLLTDPPPGASFPSLSDDSSAPSLTSIDALFQGPEGTVYANGVFKINIQIPERYPFQPPIVTFATPIYHPNIDNGGRICLDILNLPPKGTWQPSLNISTVLTSIGLLLSEPNPDDGLMHEASREYKYNRQAFDQNARSMTEKCARAGESEIAGGSHGSQSHAGPSTARTELEGSDASMCVSEHLVSRTRIPGSSRKLSLESVGSSSNRDSGVCKVPIQDYSNNHTENGQFKEANNVPAEFNVNPGKLQTTRNKLSLKVSVVPHSRNVESANILPNQCSSMSGTQTPSTDTPKSLPLEQVGNIVSMRDEDHIKRSSTSVSQDQQSLSCVKMGQTRDSGEKLRSVSQHAVSQLDATRPHKALSWSLSTTHKKKSLRKGTIAGKGSSSISTRLKGVGLIGLPVPPSGPLGCPQHHIEDEKENLAPTRSFLHRLTDQSAALPISSVVSDNGKCYNERTEREELIKAPKLSEFKPMDQPIGSINDMILHSKNPLTPHFKFLGVTNDVGSDDEKKNNQDHDGKSINMFKQLTGGPQIPEAVIVLDSEDSEDENIPVRSKLSLGKRCLSRKRKSGF